MKKISTIMLKLPDGRLVMNRRDDKAPTSPGLLAFYGGSIEDDETPLDAAMRELAEETSIDQTGLVFKHEMSAGIPSREDITIVGVEIHLFSTDIISDNFDVYEGVCSEVYELSDLVRRDDLSFSARYLLNQMILSK